MCEKYFTSVFIGFKIENRHLWCRLLGVRMEGWLGVRMEGWMDKFNVAPLSMGLAVGFLIGVM